MSSSIIKERPNKIVKNVETQEEEQRTCDKLEEEIILVSDDYFPLGEQEVLVLPNSDTGEMRQSESNESRTETRESRRTLKTSGRKGLQEDMAKAISNFSSFMETRMNPRNEEDADINFMKSVVSDMRLLSPKNKINFKKDIMNLLSEYINKEN